MSRCAALLPIAALVLALGLVEGCTPLEEAAAPQAEPEAAAALPERVENPADGSTLLLVPAGQFLMADSGRPKRVTLPAFYIDRTEVTNAQYAAFLAACEKEGDAAWRHPDQPSDKKDHEPTFWSNPHLGKAQGHHPVVGIDWFDATAYARWAGKRLPTEAEWERAARGSDGRTYPWGEQPPEEVALHRANFLGSFAAADGFKYTAPAGSFPQGASPAGCLNMAGNVCEWTADWFAPLPDARRLDNPTGPPTGTQRVVKGGSWNFQAAGLRTYNRWAMDPRKRLASVGFRCARDARPPAPPEEPEAEEK
ncbi:MAG: formylglycine-generating enzyme family protein [Candidatus Brocadiia bacterium]